MPHSSPAPHTYLAAFAEAPFEDFLAAVRRAGLGWLAEALEERAAAGELDPEAAAEVAAAAATLYCDDLTP